MGPSIGSPSNAATSTGSPGVAGTAASSVRKDRGIDGLLEGLEVLVRDADRVELRLELGRVDACQRGGEADESVELGRAVAHWRALPSGRTWSLRLLQDVREVGEDGLVVVALAWHSMQLDETLGTLPWM